MEVDQQSPEFGRCLRGGTNGGYEIIVEFREEFAVVGEFCQFGSGVEGVCGGVAGGWVGVEVGAVAEVGAAAGGGDVARAGVDRSFVDCAVGAFDAQADDVGSGNWMLGCDGRWGGRRGRTHSATIEFGVLVAMGLGAACTRGVAMMQAPVNKTEVRESIVKWYRAVERNWSLDVVATSK